EDGIRDRTVTGVQTCALPIYQTMDKIAATERRIAELERQIAALDAQIADEQQELRRTKSQYAIFVRSVYKSNADPLAQLLAAPRSEERRVGKECSSRWGTCRE